MKKSEKKPVANTVTLIMNNRSTKENRVIRPTLFTCYERTISEYRLSGTQHLGRPSGDRTPDIPINARFISREHGVFVTEGNDTHYLASETTNPIKFNGTVIPPGADITLTDGDELIIPWTDEDGSDHSVVLVYANTESRIGLWRNLQQASRDNLTNLVDRDSFVNWWVQNKDRKDYAEAVLFILDVDDFKGINDKAGHNAGDSVLKIVADELRNAVRYESQVCRWGGDEFVGIIPASSRAVSKRLEGIRSGIQEKTASAGFPAHVTIGCVDVRDAKDRRDIASLVALADQALYQAKNAGKDRIAVYLRS